MSFETDLDAVLAETREMLLAKNKAYGNSALDPVRLFSKADPIEQLKVRIDDKVSRIQRGHSAGEEPVMDWLGYLVLLRIAERQRADEIERRSQPVEPPYLPAPARYFA